jgi:hypothetical protein
MERPLQFLSILEMALTFVVQISETVGSRANTLAPQSNLTTHSISASRTTKWVLEPAGKEKEFSAPG